MFGSGDVVSVVFSVVGRDDVGCVVVVGDVYAADDGHAGGISDDNGVIAGVVCVVFVFVVIAFGVAVGYVADVFDVGIGCGVGIGGGNGVGVYVGVVSVCALNGVGIVDGVVIGVAGTSGVGCGVDVVVVIWR